VRGLVVRSVLVALACGAALCADDGGNNQGNQGGNGNQNSSSDVKPEGRGDGTKPSSVGFSASGFAGNNKAGTTGINYHNGPVLLNTVNVYYIWYGNWSNNASAVTILTALANGLGGSAWFGINKTYYQGSTTKQYVSGAVHYNGSINDNYSQGTSLTDNKVETVVSTAIKNGLGVTSGKPDANGVYFVLTSADVNETSGFCTQYCGWHTYGTISTTNVKYAFVGNPDRCPNACEWQTTSPNGNAGADGMASIIGHELSEATTDPNLNAWYDSRGEENADKCAWTFGSTSKASNGSVYNVTLGSSNFLIQQNWVNTPPGFCGLHQ
jgi:hypothetical protein